MIIIAGSLRVTAGDRDRYLDAVADVARLARLAPGCLDIVQAPDPIDLERITIFERWESLSHPCADPPGPLGETPLCGVPRLTYSL